MCKNCKYKYPEVDISSEETEIIDDEDGNGDDDDDEEGDGQFDMLCEILQSGQVIALRTPDEKQLLPSCCQSSGKRGSK